MGYPERLLSEGERIDLQLRPHWKALVFPVITLILTFGVGGFLVAIAPKHGTGAQASWIAIGAVALVLIVWLVLRPWIIWLNTNYVITNQRLIIRIGLIRRVGRDIPLNKINDVSFRHDSLLDRMLGCGTLVVESAGEHGQLELDDIPHVEETQREVSTLISGGDPTVRQRQHQDQSTD